MRIVRARQAVGVAAFAAAAVAVGCGDSTGPNCSSLDARRATVDTFLNAGQPVATFNLVQFDPSLDGGGTCELSPGDVNLVVTSNANLTQSFSYTVQGLDDNHDVIWSASGSIQRLGAGDSIDEGTIINTPFPVDAGGGVRVLLESWSSP